MSTNTLRFLLAHTSLIILRILNAQTAEAVVDKLKLLIDVSIIPIRVPDTVIKSNRFQLSMK